jgi:serine protease
MALLAARAATMAAGTAAQAGGAPEAVAAGHPRVINPYAPSYRHLYRGGAVPTRGAAARMAGWARQHPGAVTASPAAAGGAGAASANNVRYGGGNDGIGVTTGDERVYLVFFGSQWGTQGTNGNGDITLSGDPSGEAPYLQEMFKGLGTGNEQWSGVMTQYCEGVAAGAQTCPARAPHVAYPHGGALAGMWVDESAASPAQATGHQLAQEAIDAATHFGNTTAADNRDASYVILSPTGTHPDGFDTQSGQDFCAWHDWNGDTTLSGGAPPSPDGDVAFTNMPYVTDAGVNCGASFVRSGSAGKLDGVSMVAGHEYAETITDQNPAGGWVDLGGEETADKCAWIPPKPATAGSAAMLQLSTGAFAMQSVWANNANSGKGGCRFTQTIKSTQLLQNPGFETGKLAPWLATAGVLKKKSSSFPVHAGNWLARLAGRRHIRGRHVLVLAGDQDQRPGQQGLRHAHGAGARRQRHGGEADAARVLQPGRGRPLRAALVLAELLPRPDDRAQVHRGPDPDRPQHEFLHRRHRFERLLTARPAGTAEAYFRLSSLSIIRLSVPSVSV